MSNLSFNVFGTTKQRRTVSDVFEGFTKELKEIHLAELDASAKLEAEIQEKQQALEVSRSEQTRAASAIDNIRQLLGG